MKDFPRVNEPFKWTSIIRKAVSVYAQGATQQKAADEAGMSREHLSLCMKHPEVRTFYDEIIMKTGLALRSELVRTLKQVAEKKLTEALEDGDKDTYLQYQKAIREMLAMDEVVEEKKSIRIVVE